MEAARFLKRAARVEEIHFLLRWKTARGNRQGSADAAGCLFRSLEFLDAAESKLFLF